MNVDRKFGTGRAQEGSALLIAIFALLLISVVGIALLLSTGTDTALAGNYRTSTAAYYAAVAGLEEARGRLMLNNPNFLNQGNVYSTLFTGLGAPSFGPTDVLYIVNPLNGETVNPTDLSNPATYPDTEYASEFPAGLGSANVHLPSVLSVSPSPLASPPLPGPLFKWVRINAITEQSINMDVDGLHANDGVTPLFYNGSGLNRTSTGNQALELTALAVLPTGSTKILEYVIAAPAIVSPMIGVNFPSALTLIGNDVAFQGPTAGFVISGQDQINMPGCSASGSLVDAIGYTNSGDASRANVLAGATPASNYQGAPLLPGPPPAPSSQSIGDVSALLPANWQTVSGLQGIVQNITNNADVVINGNTTGNEIGLQAPAAVAGANAGPNPSPTPSPMTIVVNGDLDLTSWHHTGFGLLLVTGTLTYDPDASWEGIILVVGQGKFVSSKGGTGGIDGEVVVAKTLDASGNPLPALGSPSFCQGSACPGGGGSNHGRGINYSSCLVKSAQSVLPYKVLSFREIPQ